MSRTSAESEEVRRVEIKRDFLDVMNEAIEEYKPSKKYVLFSGGNDSTGLLYRCIQAGMCDAAVHINTGIGIEETREFVRTTCADWNVPLIEMHPPRSYDDIVMAEGFPGPGAHRFMYTRLKERAIRQLVRENKRDRKDRIMLITGVRKSESTRRMAHVDYIWRVGAQLWVAPLSDYTKGDLIDYRLENNLPENEVSALLHMSGECLCGAFAKPGELADIEKFYPKTAQRIKDLEKRVAESGQKNCVWGKRPKGRKMTVPAGPLCTNCVDPTDEEDAA